MNIPARQKIYEISDSLTDLPRVVSITSPQEASEVSDRLKKANYTFQEDSVLALKMYKQFQMDAAVVSSQPAMGSSGSSNASVKARATLALENAQQRGKARLSVSGPPNYVSVSSTPGASSSGHFKQATK